MSEKVMPSEGASRKEILANWQPENEEFWEKFGKKIAKENLIVSTIALTLSFCIWTLWGTIAAQLNAAGFKFTTSELFTLAALPGLVGATGRLFYTYMPGLVGGRNFTFFSTIILLIPVIGLGNAVQDTSTSYGTFCFLVSLIGIAGANFSASMANIGNFFPKSQKGTALGINAGVGNLGVSIIYFLAPFAMGSTVLGSLFGGPSTIVRGSLIYIQNACYIWVIPTIITLLLILKYMDNLPLPKQSPKSLFGIFTNIHTWVMTWIYTCGFGAFIGYSVALTLLVSKEFPEVSFTYAAFLGPFIGAGIRPFGGMLADKIDSGTKVTLVALIGMFITTAGILWGIEIHNFIFFFASFLITFFMTGLVTGASFRMIPHIFSDSFQSSLVTGFTAAIGAYGAFIVPKIFGYAYSEFNNIHIAFYVLLTYTAITVILTYWFYARKGANMHC